MLLQSVQQALLPKGPSVCHVLKAVVSARVSLPALFAETMGSTPQAGPARADVETESEWLPSSVMMETRTTETDAPQPAKSNPCLCVEEIAQLSAMLLVWPDAVTE